MNINKRILILIIVSALVGGVFGSLISAAPARANLFKDFYDQNLKPLFQPKIDRQSITNDEQPATNNEQSIITDLPIYTPAVDYEQAIIKAVEKASAAVVSIIISKDLPVIEQCPYNPFGNLPQEFQQFFNQGWEFYQPCQKGTKRQEIGGGSGFIISNDGLIVTNKHVILDEDASYTVLTNDGKKYEAKVLARDSYRDLAVLKISVSNFPVIRLGNSDTIKLGQTAIAIGNALGEFRNTVSVGVISGLSRNVTASGGSLTEKFEGLIQTDAAINQGNSGGPLLNLKGEVIGINVAMVSGAQNIGFAIPINQAKKAIESVKTTGRIVTPYLGVRYTMLAEGALIRGTQDGPGVLPNSPAAKAGIQAEDIILELNAEKITQGNFLASLIQKYSVGDAITLKILRNGKEMEIKVILEERPNF